VNNYTMYFDGLKLYGDDFSIEEIEKWFQDEEESYTNLYVKPKGDEYIYPYSEMDKYHAWKYLPDTEFQNVLGLGSATGGEFFPLLNKIKRITILEPSSLYKDMNNINGVPATWVRPEVSGDILYADGTFDLITGLSVLHHIPNVTHVVQECSRVLKQNGFMVLREPVISMGDWRLSRPGLTPHERGIPKKLLFEMFANSGFEIIHQSLVSFPGVERLSKFPYNNKLLIRLDSIFSSLMSWNYVYHRVTLFQKLAPRSMYFVLRKK
jgi:SAM-dependent methyltransferase